MSNQQLVNSLRANVPLKMPELAEAFLSVDRIRFVPELSGFLSTDFINGFTHVGHNMKAIQNIQRIPSLFGNHLQVRFPHITTDKFQRLAALLAEPAKES